MKRKAMEIDKSKIERARDGKGSAGNFVPSGGISSGMGGGGRGGGLGDDSTPTYSRSAPTCDPERSRWTVASCSCGGCLAQVKS